ncbi:MAG: Rieske 2Fe-2S domain-containing protein [Candidatus Binatia bacterium]
MLPKEANEMLTRVGPCTPCGELLRRFWHPVALAAEVTEARPKKRVRILGEDLVLFRLPSGDGGQVRYGLLDEHCSHRAASLYYGFVEEDGLRCAYHGWKYDMNGMCLDQPFEKNPEFKKEVCHRAYPVEKLSGLLFTYMGPRDKKPLLPRWDFLVRKDWARKIEVQPVLNCNWLQPMENAVDPSHTRFLHGETFRQKGIRRNVSYHLKKVDEFVFEPCEWGIRKRRVFENGEKEVGHILVFPNMLRHPGSLHFRVPLDDTHTQIYRIVRLNANKGLSGKALDDLPIEYVMTKNEEGEFNMDTFPSQDAMAWETQGAITDRSRELLGESDRGITMVRKLLRDQIRIVEQGGEPMGLVRDPGKNRIIEFVTTEWRGTEE